MESWVEVFAGKIPKDKYELLLQNGEREGLVITLTSPRRQVSIAFGAVSAVRMLDEGVALDDLFDEDQIAAFRAGGFDNTIYQVVGGEFDRFVKRAAGELYDCLPFKHYVIITLNFIVDVITQWEPDITVSNYAFSAMIL